MELVFYKNRCLIRLIIYKYYSAEFAIEKEVAKMKKYRRGDAELLGGA